MNAHEIAQRWIDLHNDGEPGTYGSDRFVELYAPDCCWRESPTPLTPEGRTADDVAGFRESLEMGMACFIDRSANAHEIVAHGDRAAVRLTWSATLSVDLGPDHAPIGSRLRAEVAMFLRVVDGKIVEHVDVLGALVW